MFMFKIAHYTAHEKISPLCMDQRLAQRKSLRPGKSRFKTGYAFISYFCKTERCCIHAAGSNIESVEIAAYPIC